MTDSRDYDDAVEALRKAFCALPRFSFLLDQSGSVRRVPDRYGNWVDFQSAHELCDGDVVDGLMAAVREAKSTMPMAIMGS